MNIPDGFLEGEIRNSFYVETMMKKTWAAQLKVLSVVDEICKKNNIQYFADWGTLLGAVRHKGYIPWDDDMDITMKRDDYTKFCNIVMREVEGYDIVNIHTEKEWYSFHSRIVNGKCIRFDDEHLKKFYGCPWVVGIDIFPLDYVAPTKEEDEFQCQMIKIVDVFAQIVNNCESNKEAVLQNARYLEEKCGVRFNYNKPLESQFLDLSERLRMMYKENESDKLALMSDHAGPRPLDVYPKEYYSEAIEMPFEYTTIPVPVGYDAILKQKYGENYMIPRIGGTNHTYPFYMEQKRELYSQMGIKILRQ